ncbi:thioredoxin domain-containing protein [Vibrio sp. D431a]|uniref:DsbA family protein n=1 Tax=Vibrio sp. D431a TaxID=2837388 RepID=UPI0025537EC4|nr:thioredoxin domain-containing protein [Vibrio sp. D431a]MDK9793812.1 thioredoxin domain-containing protein [Vibrio sp. D431a]
MKTLIRNLFITLAISTTTLTSYASSTDEKIYYKEVEKGDFVVSNKEKTKVEVIYFYSHNCTACRVFTPAFEQWTQSVNGDSIRVIKIPVTPSPRWIWATVLQLAIEDLKIDVKSSDITKKLTDIGATISDRDSAIAFLMNELGVDYLTAENSINLERYKTKIERYEALFKEFEAAGTPNVGITTSTSIRYIIGPQLNLNFYEMLSAINGITTFYTSKELI